jgi:hypothetical protein
MVVDDFDISRSSFIPDETDAPLIVDPDRMLSRAISLERLEPINGRNPEIVQDPSLVQKTELSQGHILNV